MRDAPPGVRPLRAFLRRFVPARATQGSPDDTCQQALSQVYACVAESQDEAWIWAEGGDSRNDFRAAMLRCLSDGDRWDCQMHWAPLNLLCRVARADRGVRWDGLLRDAATGGRQQRLITMLPPRIHAGMRAILSAPSSKYTTRDQAWAIVRQGCDPSASAVAAAPLCCKQVAQHRELWWAWERVFHRRLLRPLFVLLAFDALAGSMSLEHAAMWGLNVDVVAAAQHLRVLITRDMCRGAGGDQSDRPAPRRPADPLQFHHHQPHIRDSRSSIEIV